MGVMSTPGSAMSVNVWPCQLQPVRAGTREGGLGRRQKFLPHCVVGKSSEQKMLLSLNVGQESILSSSTVWESMEALGSSQELTDSISDSALVLKQERQQPGILLDEVC